jgi:hypothetical protein
MIRGRVFWGLVVLLIGVLLLLDNPGYLPGVNIWGLIWPLFLIATGGWILWNTYNRGKRQVEHLTIPLEGAQRASIRFQHGAGRIEIRAGTEVGNLLEGDFGGGLDVSKSRRDEALEIRLKVPGNLFPLDWSPGESLDWTASLNPNISLSLWLETGASDSHLDLQDLRITDLSLKSGASSTVLTLPASAGFTKVDIRSGAASVKISVPQDVAALVRTTGGLSNISISERFPRSGSVYQSPGYENAANKAEIYVEMGVGAVSIS